MIISFNIGDVVLCDGCSKRLHTPRGGKVFQDPSEILGQMERCYWNQRKSAGTWREYCPACEDKQGKNHSMG